MRQREKDYRSVLSTKRQIYLHFRHIKIASREKNEDRNRRWERERERERALDGPLIAVARSLFIFVHFGERDNALVTDR